MVYVPADTTVVDHDRHNGTHGINGYFFVKKPVENIDIHFSMPTDTLCPTIFSDIKHRSTNAFFRVFFTTIWLLEIQFGGSKTAERMRVGLKRD